MRSHDESLIPASVLLPLFAPGPQSEPELWLLRRAEELRTHRGQVRVPGGRRDPTDADLIATALREAHEEIGLAPSEVEVLGVLDDCVTITGFAVTPYVGWIGSRLRRAPCPPRWLGVLGSPLGVPCRSARDDRPMGDLEAHRAVVRSGWRGHFRGATASILRGFMQALGEATPPRLDSIGVVVGGLGGGRLGLGSFVARGLCNGLGFRRHGGRGGGRGDGLLDGGNGDHRFGRQRRSRGESARVLRPEVLRPEALPPKG